MLTGDERDQEILNRRNLLISLSPVKNYLGITPGFGCVFFHSSKTFSSSGLRRG
jgi:hypothetical protein